MGKPKSQSTFRDERSRARWSVTNAWDFATELSDGARTVVAHGSTPEESRERASRFWETREKQIAEVARQPVDEGLKVAFEELLLQWVAETAHVSSPMKIAAHPAYRQIVGLGPAALPLMLSDLSENRRFWFPALNSITGENPVPDDAIGDISKMAEAWIEWGRAHGLL